MGDCPSALLGRGRSGAATPGLLPAAIGLAHGINGRHFARSRIAQVPVLPSVARGKLAGAPSHRMDRPGLVAQTHPAAGENARGDVLPAV